MLMVRRLGAYVSIIMAIFASVEQSYGRIVRTIS